MPHRPGAGAVVALAILVLAGCAQPQTDEAKDAGSLTMAPGTTAHLLLEVGSSGDAAAMLVTVRDDAGLRVTPPGQMHGNGTRAAGWLGLEVPAGAAPGGHEVVLDIARADGTSRQVVVTVAVEAQAEPLGVGSVALLDLSFRTADGTLTATTVPAVDRSPLPRVDDYHAPADDAPQPIPLSRQDLPPEILWPLANASVGQSLTLELDDFFGPATIEHDQPREESVPRYQEVPRYREMSRTAAEQQGLVSEETREGDLLETTGPFSYVVITLNATTLRVELASAEGDRLTLHQAWPEGTVVTDRTDKTVTMRTDPPAEGERFTWHHGWANATEVASRNDTTIVIRHTPPVGVVYPDLHEPGVNITVVAVEDERILMSRTNPHPLAGQTVYAEVTVVGEEETPEEADAAVPRP